MPRHGKRALPAPRGVEHGAEDPRRYRAHPGCESQARAVHEAGEGASPVQPHDPRPGPRLHCLGACLVPETTADLTAIEPARVSIGPPGPTDADCSGSLSDNPFNQACGSLPSRGQRGRVSRRKDFVLRFSDNLLERCRTKFFRMLSNIGEQPLLLFFAALRGQFLRKLIEDEAGTLSRHATVDRAPGLLHAG